jgi:hypothetical protein
MRMRQSVVPCLAASAVVLIASALPRNMAYALGKYRRHGQVQPQFYFMAPAQPAAPVLWMPAYPTAAPVIGYLVTTIPGGPDNYPAPPYQRPTPYGYTYYPYNPAYSPLTGSQIVASSAGSPSGTTWAQVRSPSDEEGATAESEPAVPALSAQDQAEIVAQLRDIRLDLKWSTRQEEFQALLLRAYELLSEWTGRKPDRLRAADKQLARKLVRQSMTEENPRVQPPQVPVPEPTPPNRPTPSEAVPLPPSVGRQ